MLDPISPTVGLWPRSRPDPLGDYVGALGVVVELGASLALPGHGEPIADPAGRAPTSVVSDSTSCQPVASESARSRSVFAAERSARLKAGLWSAAMAGAWDTSMQRAISRDWNVRMSREWVT